MTKGNKKPSPQALSYWRRLVRIHGVAQFTKLYSGHPKFRQFIAKHGKWVLNYEP
jgi:hypothetical protein